MNQAEQAFEMVASRIREALANSSGRNAWLALSDELSLALQIIGSKMPYPEYLRSMQWDERRRWAIYAARNTCLVCGRKDKKLNAHHKTYARRGSEKPKDLVVLCEDHHKLFHEIQSKGEDMERTWIASVMKSRGLFKAEQIQTGERA